MDPRSDRMNCEHHGDVGLIDRGCAVCFGYQQAEDVRVQTRTHGPSFDEQVRDLKNDVPG
jgi:hypothetical protein